MLKVLLTAKGRITVAALNLAAKVLIKQAVKTEMRIYVTEVKDYLVNTLRAGGFQLKPLTTDYERLKHALYGDKPILVASEGYVRSIAVLDDAGGLRIGIKPGAISPRGVPYERIAEAAELGTRTSYARPHWRPTIEYAQLRAPSVAQGVVPKLRLGK
jgi:hypothetical protein